MRLYVGHLPYDTRTRDLDRLFSEFGDICDIDLRRGYAFVEFEDYRDAKDAIYYLDNTRFLGERIVVEESRPLRRGPSARSDYRLVVENLHSSVSWQDLKDFFRKAGDIVFVDVNRSREEGYVEFDRYDDFKYALKHYDDCKLAGRRIRLYDDRPRSRSRSRSPVRDRRRSHSRSRSRSPVARSRSASPERDCSKSPARNVRRSRSRSRSNSPDRHDKKNQRSSSAIGSRDSGNESEQSPAAQKGESLEIAPPMAVSVDA